jgi:hypothetical protein
LTFRRIGVEDTIQVVVIPALRPALEMWLLSRGLKLVKMPKFADVEDDEGDSLDTYFVSPISM